MRIPAQKQPSPIQAAQNPARVVLSPELNTEIEAFVESWGSLSEDVRAEILALVRSDAAGK